MDKMEYKKKEIHDEDLNKHGFVFDLADGIFRHDGYFWQGEGQYRDLIIVEGTFESSPPTGLDNDELMEYCSENHEVNAELHLVLENPELGIYGTWEQCSILILEEL